MRRTLQLIGCGVAVWLAAPPIVTADPITITSGVITLSSHASPALASTTLAGSDGTRIFTFEGVIQAAENYFGPYYCYPCVSEIGIRIFSALLGAVTYGDESYPVTYAGVGEEGLLNFFVPDVRIPLPVPVAPGETQTFSAPFTASGNLSPPYDPFDPNPGLRNTLTGSGIATVTLFADPSFGGRAWVFQRAEYQLSAPAPTPEPASFLLFASGLSALVLRRRSRAV